jgi:uncharacterized protein
MLTLLPEYLDFAQKARNGCEIRGFWPINRLKRLAEVVHSDQGNIEAEVVFDHQDRLQVVTGHVTAGLKLTCQRCMQAMDYPLHTEFKLALVTDEAQADRLPDDYEPLLLADDRMSLPELLEDEILLAIPLVAMHEYDCSDYLLAQEDQQQAEAGPVTEKANPFSVLKDLL